jgi:hypothetical protein
VHPWRTPQDIHAQPRIVREDQAGKLFGSGKRLDTSVFSKGPPRLLGRRDLRVSTQVRDLKSGGKQGAEFLGFVGVLGGDEKR